MLDKFVKVRFNLKCDWEGFSPEYRLYVNDELFTERTYRARKPYYYKEMLQVTAPPGRYKIKLEIISPYNNDLIISDTYIECGEGRVINDLEFEIL